MEKMMIPDNYKPIRQVGNGNTVEFSFDFPLISENFVEVFREKDGVQSVVDSNEYSVQFDDFGGSVTFNEAPSNEEIIVITRNIPLEQVTPYKTSSGFPAVRIEENFDKLTAIAQQMSETLDRCVKVEITGDQTPEELLIEVYGKLNSATEVAQNAVEAANAATDAVASAEKTLADVTNYVNTSKTEIDALVTKTTNEIDQTIEEATEEIKEAAVAEADKAVQENIGTSVIEAATSSEHARIWAEGEQAEVETLGGELSSKGWALQASNSAASANQSAAQAKTSETNAKSYAESLQSLLPNQIGNAGKYLTTDGTNPKWAEVVSTTITYWE